MQKRDKGIRGGMGGESRKGGKGREGGREACGLVMFLDQVGPCPVAVTLFTWCTAQDSPDLPFSRISYMGLCSGWGWRSSDSFWSVEDRWHIINSCYGDSNLLAFRC